MMWINSHPGDPRWATLSAELAIDAKSLVLRYAELAGAERRTTIGVRTGRRLTTRDFGVTAVRDQATSVSYAHRQRSVMAQHRSVPPHETTETRHTNAA